jgi:chromosome segregation ATPase
MLKTVADLFHFYKLLNYKYLTKIKRIFVFIRPDNVPRLFDLVRVKDPKVSTAFFFALRNTLVADNLEKATRIAFQVFTYKREI